MIEFRQKLFTEYDAMRSLYVELMKYSDKKKFGLIDTSQLLPILKGNNVVIERFVISTSFGHGDKYRMYLKIGAKAKLPDEVRLPGQVYDKRLLNVKLNLGRKLFSETTIRQKEFGKNKGKGGGGNNNNGGSAGEFGFKTELPIDISVPVTKLLGDAIKYDKRERSLVLEFRTIKDAIDALNILPFGLNYKIYLLEI